MTGDSKLWFSVQWFLCVYFCRLVFVLHCILPGIRAKECTCCLLASVLFYAYGEPVYIILLFISTLLNYFCACGIDRFQNHKKGILVLAVICNLGILIVFKYTDFILGNGQQCDRASSAAATDPHANRNLILHLPGNVLCDRCIPGNNKGAEELCKSTSLYILFPTADRGPYCQVS